MAKNLFVGNISYQSTDDSLAQAFSQYGTVVSAKIIKDKFSGRSRGFGFIEMGTEEEAQAAIQGLNDQPLDGRNITVREAHPRSSDSGSGQSYSPPQSSSSDPFGGSSAQSDDSSDDQQQADDVVFEETPPVEEPEVEAIPEVEETAEVEKPAKKA
ncbi:RNA-binding protein [Patescibacteria group bacterium]|nr:RNA-binding protein [Patescibacteria group bacterium]MCG2702415.1 RNA-binding protein [Candidatus Parcubacteria bacterium]MBU4210345.1 RNA-binding protein [Patescibacteria group bacterium]MBU4264535.1 RNA-binding protein [Patescibacteria group bacterium]MBU4390466.1 RNA-binding protein [Patescibacteria group bacterium]